MKSFIVFVAIVAAALAAPANTDADAQIVQQQVDNIGVDRYNYKSETSNGIKQEEEGQLNNIGTENEAISVRGQFSYVGDDGVVYSVVYTSGVEGFQPQGAHIPQAP